MNYRLGLLVATLVPMVLYYLALGVMPELMATTWWLGLPLSIITGVLVMGWGVIMAMVYVIIYPRMRS